MPADTIYVNSHNEQSPLIFKKLKKKGVSRFRVFKRFILIALFGGFLLYIIGDIITIAVCDTISKFGKRISKEALTASYLSSVGLESADQCSKWSKTITENSHLAGENKELVDFTKAKFEEFGLKTHINSYDVYLNTPVANSVTLYQNESTFYTPSLKEDLSTGNDDIPTFHGYSANGNVTGEYIWANYGTKQDIDLLIEQGVDFTNKVVIVKYGKIYRGLKVKFAQDAGAIATIIYTDPHDDGKITKENGYLEYPDGPARNPSSVQRGSVLFLSYLPGDPTTPGYPSKKGAERVDPHNVIPRIPSLPMSYRDVLPILETLEGFGVKFGDSKLSSGPNPKFTLNVYNNQSYDIKPIYNVVGEFEGILKDEVIILGNHRDAWIKGGAGDPNSGTAVMFEIIRNLNKLKQSGWRPLRTIMFISWDGEEIGLIGSTEFVEEYSSILKRNVVAYLNLDMAVSGTTLRVGASPILNDLLSDCMKKVYYPENEGGLSKPQTLYDHFQDMNKDGIDILGSGSDYTAFLEHIGISSADIQFSSNGDKDPIYHYHSNYDNWDWMNEYGDPTWKFHETMVKYYGLIVLELCETELLRFNVNTYMKSIVGYYDEITKMVKDLHMDKKTQLELDQICETTTNRLYKIKEISKWFMKHVELLQQDYQDPNLKYWDYLKLLKEIKMQNNKLKNFERSFITSKGLTDRDWFKHLIFASGRYTGYEGQTLPGLREALEDRDITAFKEWNVELLQVLHDIEIHF